MLTAYQCHKIAPNVLSSNPKLPVVSQPKEQQTLKKDTLQCQEVWQSNNHRGGGGGRQGEVGRNPQRSLSPTSGSKQDQLQSQIRLLRALFNWVLKMWMFRNPSGHTFQYLIILIMKNFCSGPARIFLATASYPFIVYSPRNLPELSIHSFQCCAQSTHPLQKHLYH